MERILSENVSANADCDTFREIGQWKTE